VPEVVPDGICGILVEDNDIDGLAKGIIELLTDENKRIGLGEKGREYIKKNFDLKDRVRELLDVCAG
jgi:glycosyltransferase involved in cell wall biosynthesis